MTESEDVLVPSQPPSPEERGGAASGTSDREDELTGALGELSRLLVDEDDLSTTLRRVADLAVRVIPGCSAAGVTMLNGGRPTTAAHTDERTLKVDSRQYDAGDGPCLTAARELRVVIADARSASSEWPTFWEDASAASIHSFLAAPLVVRGEGIGSLNLYGERPRAFEAVDEALVALFAGQASIALANARLYREAVALAEQLRAAMESRAVIEQAKGVIMARRTVDADAAFGLLRDASMRANRKLRDVAREVVESTIRRPVR